MALVPVSVGEIDAAISAKSLSAIKKWWNGEISGERCAKILVDGAADSMPVAGFVGGSTAGAAIGALAGPVGATIGSLIGSAAGAWAGKILKDLTSHLK